MWTPEIEFPGLAVSRSIGDYKLHQYGVTHEPEIVEYQLKPGDCTLVIGSAPLFDYLTNQEVTDIVMQYYDAGQCDQAAN